MIPSCTTWTIRNSFPSENQEYTHFIESNGIKDCTWQYKANNNYCQYYSFNKFPHMEPLILLQTVKKYLWRSLIFSKTTCGYPITS